MICGAVNTSTRAIVYRLHDQAEDEESKSLEQHIEKHDYTLFIRNKTNDLILNLTPENVTQHSRKE